MKHPILIILLAILPATLTAQLEQFPGGPNASDDKTTISTITPSVTTIKPGDTFHVALTLKIPKDFVAYYSNPGTVGDPPKVSWKMPEGFTASPTLFPLPQKITKIQPVDDIATPVTSYGYQGTATFLFEINSNNNLPLNTKQTISGTAEWQICSKDTCLPEEKEFSFTVQTADSNSPNQPDLFEKSKSQLASDSSDWQITSTEKDDQINLFVIAPPGATVRKPIYFFSSDRQIDSQIDQDVKISDQTITISTYRNRGHASLLIDGVQPLPGFSGLLTYHDDSGNRKGIVLSSIKDGTKVNSAIATKAASKSSHLGFIEATDEDRTRGAQFYDADAKLPLLKHDGKAEEKLGYFLGMGFLFIGGLLLNLMPCVFPVLGLKVMGFVSQSGEDTSKIKKHGLIFTLGLVAAMWVLATVVIASGLKWGDQLNNPTFLASMIILFFLMGLNLYGLFEIGTKLTSVGAESQNKKGYSGSFNSGILTTLVATPCSGPFLGTAMAFATSLPPFQAFIAFTIFGLGIASPYLLLSFFPALIQKLPKPGPWMTVFKQIMSFFLFATAVFFMRAYMRIVGDSHFNFFLFALVLIALGAYIYGKWSPPHISRFKRYITGFALGGLLVIGGTVWAINTAKRPSETKLVWQEWYPGIVEEHQAKGQIVWVDYTADT